MSSNGWLSIDDYIAEIDLYQTDESFNKLHEYYSSLVKRRGSGTTKLNTLLWRLRTSRPEYDFMIKTPIPHCYPGGYLKVSVGTRRSCLGSHFVSIVGLPGIRSIGIPNTGFFKDFISLEEALSFLDSIKELYELDEVYLSTLGFLDAYTDEDLPEAESALFPTLDDWHDNYDDEGVPSVRGYLRKIRSNLDIWEITFHGDGEYQKSIDITGKEVAVEYWTYLSNKPYVNKNDLEEPCLKLV